jgi:hypothetical protein
MQVLSTELALTCLLQCWRRLCRGHPGDPWYLAHWIVKLESTSGQNWDKKRKPADSNQICWRKTSCKRNLQGVKIQRSSWQQFQQYQGAKIWTLIEGKFFLWPFKCRYGLKICLYSRWHFAAAHWRGDTSPLVLGMLSKSYLYQQLKIGLGQSTRLGVITEDHKTTCSEDAYTSFVLDDNGQRSSWQQF